MALMPEKNSIKNQLRRNTVALISLVVAVTSLGYNTWRNEQSEANRNVRDAGIELLLKFGELDRVVFFSHYERDRNRGNPRLGWAYVLTIRDLGTLMPEPASQSTAALVDVWESNWPGLGGDSNEPAERISAAIDQGRNDILALLRSLD